MSLLKSVARAGLHRLGGIQAFRAFTRDAVRILMYHNFPPDTAMLRAQCEHMARHYRPVAMKQVAAALHGGEPLPPRAVAITVDDGYRDFLLYAHPVLREFEIPATVFLVSDFIDGKSMLWWDRLAYAFRETTRDKIAFALNGSRRIIEIDRSRPREQSRSVVSELKKLPNAERTRTVDQVIQALEVIEPDTPPQEFAPLTWNEIRLLAKSNVEFGAHTRTHPILSSLASSEETLQEIRCSRDRLATELGSPVLHFCYPNGRDEDIGDDAVRFTRECGFRTAVTTVPGTDKIGSRTDPWRLKRLGVSFDLPLYYYAEQLAGVRKS